MEGIDNSPDGTYIFYKNNNFHVVFTEKVKIRIHKEYDKVEDVLWDVLEIVLFDVAMDYALKNRSKEKISGDFYSKKKLNYILNSEWNLKIEKLMKLIKF